MFHILVAEDDYSLRELMSDYLAENGYQVYQAKTARRRSRSWRTRTSTC